MGIGTLNGSLVLCLIVMVPFRVQASEGQDRKLIAICDPAMRVSEAVNFCEDNDAFVRAGEACLARLEELAKKETQALRGNFSGNKESRQAGKFQASAEDYTATSTSLLKLMAITENALEDIYEYKDLAVLPEDSDDPEVTGNDSTAYAMGIDCYGDVQASLDSILNDFDHKLGEFIAAKEASDSFLAKAGLRKKNLSLSQGSSPVREVSKTAGQGSATPSRGKSPRELSSITGLKEDQAKRMKK